MFRREMDVIELLLMIVLLPNGEIEMLAAGTPSRKKRSFCLVNARSIVPHLIRHSQYFWLFIWLNCCESEVSICPMVFWSPPASNWTMGLFVNPFGELCKLVIKSVMPSKSGRTWIEDIFTSVVQYDVSRMEDDQMK